MTAPDTTRNVDPSEISKFEAVAARWWDRKGVFRALHDINGLRLGYISDRAPLEGSRVLDVGCGGGILSEAMAASGAQVTGIDLGEAPLAAARLHLQQHPGLEVDYRRISAEELAGKNPAAFDVVTCLELLEHVPDPFSIIRACRDLLRPGGNAFFATLNRNPKSFLFAIVAAEYILGLVPRRTHSYARFIKPAEMNAWAEKAGLLPVDLTGLHYNPLRRRYSLGGNTHVNYLMHFRRPS